MGSQSLHPSGTSFFASLHPKGKNCHFIPGTSYKCTTYHAALHIKVTSYQCTSYQGHFIPVHFIPRPLHTSHFIPIVTSYQCTSYQGHFISVHFIPKSLHTEVISYQSQISHFVPMHCIPVQFILVISCRSLYTSPLIHVHFI